MTSFIPLTKAWCAAIDHLGPAPRHLGRRLGPPGGDGPGQRRGLVAPTSAVQGGLQAVLEDGPERGDAGGHAPDAEGVADPRRHAGALGRHDAERDLGDGGIGEADAHAADEEPGKQRRPARRHGQAGEEPDAHGRDRQPHAQRQAGRDPLGQGPRRQRHHERQRRQGQEALTALERRQPEVVLEVEGEVRQQGEHPGADAEGGDRHPGERRLAEERQVEHGAFLAQLDDHEQRRAARPRRRG